MNRSMIEDFVRATYLHEVLRTQHGPGNAALSDPRYIAAHSVMSKLARALNEGATPLSSYDLDAIVAKYKDLPESVGFNITIIGSC